MREQTWLALKKISNTKIATKGYWLWAHNVFILVASDEDEVMEGSAYEGKHCSTKDLHKKDRGATSFPAPWTLHPPFRLRALLHITKS